MPTDLHKSEQRKEESDVGGKGEFPVRWGRVLSFLGFGILMIIVAFWVTNSSREKVHIKMQRVEETLKAGKEEEAIVQYEKKMAIAIQRTDDAGIEAYKEIIQNNPTNAAAYNNLGLLLLKKGLVDEAIVYYTKAIEINPQLPGALKNMANALVIKKKYKEAEGYYKKAISLNPGNPVLYNNLGSLYAYQAQIKKAVKYYEKAVALNPDYYEAVKNLAKAKRDLNKF